MVELFQLDFVAHIAGQHQSLFFPETADFVPQHRRQIDPLAGTPVKDGQEGIAGELNEQNRVVFPSQSLGKHLTENLSQSGARQVLMGFR